MDALTRLEELLNRASKITDGQAKESATILLDLCNEAQDDVKTADCLMRFKSNVCLFFFEEAVQLFEPEKIESLHATICTTEAYKKNANHAATTRGFIISAILVKHELSIARAILMRTIADVEKDGKFSDSVIGIFKQIVVEYCGGIEPIMILGEKEWEKADNRNKFTRFMDAVKGSIVTIVSTGEISETLPPSANITAEEPELPSPQTKDNATRLMSELLAMILSASKEASTLQQSLSGSNGTISLLRKDIASRDTKIEELSTVVSERDHEITELQRRIVDVQNTLHDKENYISDLSERLKTAMQMDNISQNQELLTLKTNLQNGLKVEYSDYLASKDGECNPDSYGAMLGSLARIFKTLRRFGIIID
jgi:hypothetical protein